MKKFVKRACVLVYSKLRNIKNTLCTVAYKIEDNLFLVRYIQKKMQGNQVVISPGDKRIIVFAPHVDDEILGIGGIIKKHIDVGTEVTIVYMTDGRWSYSKKYQQEEMALARKAEGTQIAEKLGCKCVFFDAISMQWNPENYVTKITELIFGGKQCIVYTVNPIDVNADHFLATQCVYMALRETQYKGTIRMYQVQRPLPVGMWQSFVNITDVMQIKKECLAIFNSQMSMVKSFEKVVYLNQCIGKAVQGYGYAEIFCEITVEELRKMLDFAEKHNPTVSRKTALVSANNCAKRAIIAADRMAEYYERKNR